MKRLTYISKVQTELPLPLACRFFISFPGGFIKRTSGISSSSNWGCNFYTWRSITMWILWLNIYLFLVFVGPSSILHSCNVSNPFVHTVVLIIPFCLMFRIYALCYLIFLHVAIKAHVGVALNFDCEFIADIAQQITIFLELDLGVLSANPWMRLCLIWDIRKYSEYFFSCSCELCFHPFLFYFR